MDAVAGCGSQWGNLAGAGSWRLTGESTVEMRIAAEMIFTQAPDVSKPWTCLPIGRAQVTSIDNPGPDLAWRQSFGPFQRLREMCAINESRCMSNLSY